MSTDAITMQDLELEHAELLPSRETLNACCRSPHSNSYSVTNGSYNGNGDGNGNWGLICCFRQRRRQLQRQHDPVAPSRLKLLACALPEGDARPAREGRPGRPLRTRGGPPAYGTARPGPQPGRAVLTFWVHAREEQP